MYISWIKLHPDFLKITSGKTRLSFHNEVDTNLVDYISLLFEQNLPPLPGSPYQHRSMNVEKKKKSISSFYNTYSAFLRLKYHIFKNHCFYSNTLNFRSEIIIKFWNSALHTLIILSKKIKSTFVL